MVKELILNKTPIRTSNNFGINDIKLNIELPKINNFDKIDVKGEDINKLDIQYDKNCENGFSSKIGLEFDYCSKIKLTVKQGMVINTPIYINYLFDGNNSLIDEIEIIFEENSKASFILYYKCANNNTNYFHHLKQTTKLGKNSIGNISALNLLNDKSHSFIAVENCIEENAKLNYSFIDFGGERKISNYYTNLIGDNSENDFKNIYLGTNNDILDLNYHVEISGKKSNCNIEAQGAIDGQAKKNFKGTIDFKEGASNSIGEENENCVILSDNAISKSLPMLLCHEENVQGAHGVSSGKIEEDKLFYLMSKGISKKEAEKLIIKANFNKIINEIEDENLRNEIIDIIECKL